MNAQGLSNVAGLTIQLAGVVLITALSLFITRSMRRTFIYYWAAGWCCLTVALASLLISLQFSFLRTVVEPLYFMGEYCFAYLFIAGCRNRATGARIGRPDNPILVAGIVLSLVFTFLTRDFNLGLIPHSAIIAVLFFTAYLSLRPARRGLSVLGYRVMSVALILLAIDFFHYVPLFIYTLVTGEKLTPYFLQYSSIYDLLLELLLGFGTIMVVMEDASEQIEAANLELTATRDRFEALARIDPLTEALNRHAFSWLLETGKDPSRSTVRGCAIVIDIDNLKPINDTIGHAAGDEVIRNVASAIRSVIRADDLLFRWGGDEFMVLLFGVTEPESRMRLDRLNPLLEELQFDSSSEPMHVSVSFGVAQFEGLSEIERAIEEADGNMYNRKHLRRASGETVGLFTSQVS